MGRKGILIVIVLALLFGGGAGATFFLGMNVDATPEGPPVELVEPGKVAFVKLTPIMVPLVRRGQTERFLQLSVSVEIPEGADLMLVRKHIPRLRDAFVLEINSRSIMRGDGSGLIDFEVLKVRLLAQARRLLGNKNVNDVLLSNAIG